MTLRSLLLIESCNMCVIFFNPPYVQSRLCFRISQSWHDLTGSVCVPCPYGYFLKAVINYVCNCLPLSIHLYVLLYILAPVLGSVSHAMTLPPSLYDSWPSQGPTTSKMKTLCHSYRWHLGGLGPDCQSNETVWCPFFKYLIFSNLVPITAMVFLRNEEFERDECKLG